MPGPTILEALVRRAATPQCLLNSQDAILVLRALSSLRHRSNAVRSVCDSCVVAITSARITVSVERAVEALASLVALQATPLPLVHENLAARLLELGPDTATPQSIHKATVVAMKLGRRYCPSNVAVHLFDTAAQLAMKHPNDTAMQLAAVSMFPFVQQHTAERTSAFLNASTCLVKTPERLCELKGNAALQALHALAPLEHIHRHSHVRTKDDEKWEPLRAKFRKDLQIELVVPGGYAQFLFDFLRDFTHDGANTILGPLLNENKFCRALNMYDVAKIATALSDATLLPANVVEKPLAVLVGQVEYLHRFHRAHRVDEASIAALWRAARRIAGVRAQDTKLLHRTIHKLVALTNRGAFSLTGTAPSVLHAMCTCLRNKSLRDVEGFANAIDAVATAVCTVTELPMRACVVALHAASTLLHCTIEETEHMASAESNNGSMESSQEARSDLHTSPNTLQTLVVDMVQRILRFRFRDYSPAAVPLLLRALAQLVAAKGDGRLSPDERKLTSRALHYAAGRRDEEWTHQNAPAVAAALLTLLAAAPTDLSLQHEAQVHLLPKGRYGQREGGGGTEEEVGGLLTLAGPKLTAIDAAYALRIMSRHTRRGEELRVSQKTIADLCSRALDQHPLSVDVLLHLLRANAEPGATRCIFDKSSAERILHATALRLEERRPAVQACGRGERTQMEELREAGRIVHALLTSHILIRLQRSLRSCEGLYVAVVEVIDSLEKSKVEGKKTLFEMRLLCDG